MRADIRQIDRLATRMRQQLRRRAFALGRRLHDRKPEAFARWLRASFEERVRNGPRRERSVRNLHTLKTFAGEELFHVAVESG